MSDWEVRFSNTRRVPYFYRASTNESRWDAPPGLSDDDIRKLPGYEQYARLAYNAGASASVGGAGAGGGGKEGQIRASHLLVKHEGSRRPSSWKEKTITRSKSEAMSILRSHQSHLNSISVDLLSSEFAKLSKTESDCSSASRGGDLGWFGKGQMQKPFEEAAYALEKGQMSGIVETDSGLHLIFRTG